MTNLDSIFKSRDITLSTKVSSQGYGFSSSCVWMWELDYKESWAPKNWCFWTVVLEKTLESPLDCKEIQPVHPKWNQSWIFIGRTDAEAETPILCHLMWRADSFEKKQFSFSGLIFYTLPKNKAIYSPEFDILSSSYTYMWWYIFSLYI